MERAKKKVRSASNGMFVSNVFIPVIVRKLNQIGFANVNILKCAHTINFRTGYSRLQPVFETAKSISMDKEKKCRLQFKLEWLWIDDDIRLASPYFFNQAHVSSTKQTERNGTAIDDQRYLYVHTILFCLFAMLPALAARSKCDSNCESEQKHLMEKVYDEHVNISILTCADW